MFPYILGSALSICHRLRIHDTTRKPFFEITFLVLARIPFKCEKYSLFLDVFVVVVDTLALSHLSGLKCNHVTHADLGTRSGCHSNVPEIKAVFYKLFHLFTCYFTRFGRFTRFGGFVSLVLVDSFRSFCFVVEAESKLQVGDMKS